MKNWNHNNHYHKTLLKLLPVKTEQVLDIGSGLGEFTYLLAARCVQVFSLEPDAASMVVNKQVNYSYTNIEYIQNSFLEHDFGNTRFDAIVAIASVHHMNFRDCLDKMKQLLKPGGRIIILGLYREKSFFDYVLSIAAILPNFFRNLFAKIGDSKMITTRPEMTYADVKRESSVILQNSCIQRKLYWRYLLVYESIPVKKYG